MQKIQFRSSENLNIDFDFIHFFLSTNICSLWFRLQIYQINEIITRNVEQINCNCNYLLIKNTFGIMRKCCDYRFAWNRWKCDNIFIDFFSFLVFYAKITFSHFRIVHLAFSVVFMEDQWITLINNGSWACSLWPFFIDECFCRRCWRTVVWVCADTCVFHRFAHQLHTGQCQVHKSLVIGHFFLSISFVASLPKLKKVHKTRRKNECGWRGMQIRIFI